MAATGAGWAALPINLSFGDAIKGLQKELSGPVAKAAKQAGDALEGGIGKGADQAAKQVEKAQYRVKKSTQELEDAESKYRAEKLKQEAADKALEASARELAAAREKGGAAAERAEEKFLKAQARSETAANNTRKAHDKLKDAQEESAKAAKKLEDQLEELEHAERNAADEAEDSRSVFKRLGDSMREAANDADDMGGKFRGGLGLGAVAGVAASLTSEVVGSFSDLVAGATEASDATDKFKSTLDFAGLDTSTIEQVTAQAQKYADQTVYDLGDIQNMTAQLAANGVDNYAGLAEAAGNLNAIAGGNADTFKSVGMVMSQTAGAGKLTTENWNQLADAIPGASGKVQEALEQAGAYTGNFRDAMAEGQITAEEFNAAVMELGNEPVAVEAAKSTQTFEGMLGNLQATIQGGLANAFTELKPYIETFVNGLSGLAEKYLPVMVDGLKDGIEKLKTFGEWVQKNRDWLEPLGVALGVMAGGLAAIAFQQQVVAAGGLISWVSKLSAVTKIQTGLQAALNLVMNANPFVLVATAVAALVAGLIYFFTKTETGREMWEKFTEALRLGMDWVGEKWNEFTALLSAGWTFIKTSVIDAWNNAWAALQVGWAGITTAVSAAWNTVKDGLSAGWNWIKTTVIDAWSMYWTGVQAGFEVIKNALVAAWNFVRDVFVNVWNAIKTAVVDAFVNAFNVLRGAFTVVTGALSGAWDTLKNALMAGWQWIDSKVIGGFRSGMDAFKGFFQSVVDGIGSAWDGLRSLLAKPINFMIGTVYNGGILKAWNTIAGFLPGLSEASPLSTIPEHRKGGRIVGPGTGTSDDVLMWGSNGEHMLTYDDVQDLGGHGAVYAMRNALQHGQGFTFDGKSLQLLPRHLDNKKGDLVGAAPELFPKYRDGGEIRPMWEIQLERGHKWAQSRHGRPYVLGGSANGAGGTDCSGFMSGIANVIQGGDGARQWATMAFNNGGNQQMPSGPQGFVAGLKAHTLSIGVTNGGAAGGHTAGTLGAVGSFPAVNVESGGAPSMVKYGVGAAGADDSYFRTHYHLPIGPDGAFVSGGNGPSPEDMRKGIKDKVSSLIDKALNPILGQLPSPPPQWQGIPRGYYDKGKKSLIDGAFKVVDGLGDKLSSVWTAAGEVKDLVAGAAKEAASWVNDTVRSIVVRDQGGIVRNGTAAVNLSGKDELMLPPATTAAFTQFLKDMPGTAGALERAAVAWQEAAEEFDLGETARKSAEDYAADNGNTILSSMGLEGLIGIGQTLGTRALEAYQADPWTAGVTGDGVWAASASRRISASASGHGATIVIEAESDEDLVRAGQLRELAGRVNGVEVELRKPRRPKAAVVTKGGVM